MATQSAAERRTEARMAFDAFIAACPTRKLLDRISDKWVSLILVALENGPRRYNDLTRRIAGVSQKMLTQTLRTLERDGIVSRTVTPSVPVRVDYELTSLGTTLLPVMREIKNWAEAHIEEVEASQVTYDELKELPAQRPQHATAV